MLILLRATHTRSPPPCPSCWILLVACSVPGCLTSASLLSILCSVKWVTVPDDKPTTLLRCAVLASHISPSQQHQTVSTLIISPSTVLTVPSALVELHLPLPELQWLNGLNTCIHIHSLLFIRILYLSYPLNLIPTWNFQSTRICSCCWL